MRYPHAIVDRVAQPLLHVRLNDLGKLGLDLVVLISGNPDGEHPRWRVEFKWMGHAI